MDRQQVLAKIAKMLRLVEQSTFEGETSAAAEMIDKLCKQYGVTVEQAGTVDITTEDHFVTKRMADADFVLFGAVARFYDATGYVNRRQVAGRMTTTFKCIGSQAQQIQVKLYYEFLNDTMIRQCKIALAGEKVLAEMLGKYFSSDNFRKDFKIAFAKKVCERLTEMKQLRDPHPDKEATAIVAAQTKIRTRNVKAGSSNAAALGSNAGANASLNKQATAAKNRLQLTAA